MLPDLVCGLQGEAPGMAERLSEFLKQEKYFSMWTLAYAPFILWLIAGLIRWYPGRKQTEGQVAEEQAAWVSGTGQSIKILTVLRGIGTFVLCDIELFLLLFR